MKCLLALSFLLFHLSSAHSQEIEINNEAQIKKEMGFTTTRFHMSPDPKSGDVPTPSGYTYVYTGTHHFDGDLTCEQMFDQMDTALSSELYYGENLFGSTFMGCWTDYEGNPLELFVQAVVEPRTIGSIQHIVNYILTHQGKSVGDTKLNFKSVRQVISRFELGAWDIQVPLITEVLLSRGAVTKIFHSIREDYDYHAEIRAEFWKPMSEFLPFVEKYIGLSLRKTFERYALPRANGVLADYERYYVLPHEEVVKNWLLKIVPFRNCKNEPNGRCL